MGKQQNNATQDNLRVLRNSLIIVVLMLGFAFALIPLGKKCLEWLGYSGEAKKVYLADLNKMKEDKNRQITVEFFSDVNSKLPWKFHAAKTVVTVHPGQMKRVVYVVQNMAGKESTGLARFNIHPPEAGRYFNKTECFCFTQQTLKKGEIKDMPLVFVIDPRLPKRIKNIVLTYEFLHSEKKPDAKDKQAKVDSKTNL